MIATISADIVRSTSLQTEDLIVLRNRLRAKLNDLYAKAGKVYQKGYQAKGLVEALDMGMICEKNKAALKELEGALGESIQAKGKSDYNWPTREIIEPLWPNSNNLDRVGAGASALFLCIGWNEGIKRQEIAGEGIKI